MTVHGRGRISWPALLALGLGAACHRPASADHDAAPEAEADRAGRATSRGGGERACQDADTEIVSVKMLYPGASPTEVMADIVAVVEAMAEGLDGVTRVDAVARDGQAIVQLHTDLGHGPALLEHVRTELGRVTWPDESIIESVTRDRGQSAFAVVLVAPALGPVGRGLVSTTVERLRRLPEVADVDELVAEQLKLTITVEPRRLAAHGLTRQGFIAAIERALPPPDHRVPNDRLDNGGLGRTVVPNPPLDVEALGRTIVSVSATGVPLRLNDIAELRLATGKTTRASLADEPSAVLWVRLAPDGDPEDLTQALEAGHALFRPGTEFRVSGRVTVSRCGPENVRWAGPLAAVDLRSDPAVAAAMMQPLALSIPPDVVLTDIELGRIVSQRTRLSGLGVDALGEGSTLMLSLTDTAEKASERTEAWLTALDERVSPVAPTPPRIVVELAHTDALALKEAVADARRTVSEVVGEVAGAAVQPVSGARSQGSINLVPNEVARRLGISDAAIGRAIRNEAGGNVTHLRPGVAAIDVAVVFGDGNDATDRTDVEAIGDLQVETPSGATVKVRDVAELEVGVVAAPLRRRDGRYIERIAITVSEPKSELEARLRDDVFGGLRTRHAGLTTSLLR